MNKVYTLAEYNAALSQFDLEDGKHTENDIKKKYHKLAMRFHSDKNDGEMKKAYEDAFKMVGRYREVLVWKLVEGIEPTKPEEPIKPPTQSRRDYSPYPHSRNDDFTYTPEYRRGPSSDSDDEIGHGHSKEYMDAYKDYIRWKKKVEANEKRARQEKDKEPRYYNSRREERSSGHSSHRRDSDRQHDYRPQYAPEPKQYTRRHDSDEKREEYIRKAARAREDAEAQRKFEGQHTQGPRPRPRPDVKFNHVRAPPSSTAHPGSRGHDDRFSSQMPAPGAPRTARPVPTRDEQRGREHRQGTSSTKTTIRMTSGVYVNGHPVERTGRVYVNGYPVDTTVCDEYVNEGHYYDSPDEYADEHYYDRVNSGSKYAGPPKSSYYPKDPRSRNHH